jgi:hypothetical protein
MTDLENRVKNLEEMLDMINKNINIRFDKIEETINEFKKKLEISNSPDVRLPTALDTSDKSQDTTLQIESRNHVYKNENMEKQKVND